MKGMRWMRAALLFCAAATACRFSLIGLDVGGDDMAFGGGDLAGSPLDLSNCACPNGCGGTPSHCLELAPSGPVPAGDYGMAGLATKDITANIVINTDTGQI